MSNVSPKKVIIDHDGGVDDLVAMALLCSRPKLVELIGVVVIDADCFVNDGASVSGKVLSLLDFTHVPVGKSSLSGVHEFPKEWRKDAVNMNDMPCVNTPQVLKKWKDNKQLQADVPGEQLLADLVVKATSPVTIVVTGPLSNVAWAINNYGEKFLANVESVAIMGGAVDVKGNVFLPTTDGSAEWNIYWDAPAAKTVVEAKCKKVFFSLDSTNHVPITSEFVQCFGHQNEFLLSQFVGSSWAMCTHFSHIYGEENGYFAWDALTSAFVLNPNLVDIQPVSITVITGTDKNNEGQTLRVASGDDTAALSPMCFIALNTKAKDFYDMVLECCRLP